MRAPRPSGTGLLSVWTPYARRVRRRNGTYRWLYCGRYYHEIPIESITAASDGTDTTEFRTFERLLSDHNGSADDTATVNTAPQQAAGHRWDAA